MISKSECELIVGHPAEYFVNPTEAFILNLPYYANEVTLIHRPTGVRVSVKDEGHATQNVEKAFKELEQEVKMFNEAN